MGVLTAGLALALLVMTVRSRRWHSERDVWRDMWSEKAGESRRLLHALLERNEELREVQRGGDDPR